MAARSPLLKSLTTLLLKVPTSMFRYFSSDPDEQRIWPSSSTTTAFGANSSRTMRCKTRRISGFPSGLRTIGQVLGGLDEGTAEGDGELTAVERRWEIR